MRLLELEAHRLGMTRNAFFAYGSNLDWKQIRDRCPSAKFVCTANLPEHWLDFTRKSSKKDREGGVADVISDPHQAVWGVVYHVDETDVGRLDRSEGFRPNRPVEQNSYVRVSSHVFKEGNEEDRLVVFYYVANKQDGWPFMPHPNYKRLIIAGARFWHLPDPYVEALERKVT